MHQIPLTQRSLYLIHVWFAPLIKNSLVLFIYFFFLSVALATMLSLFEISISVPEPNQISLEFLVGKPNYSSAGVFENRVSIISCAFEGNAIKMRQRNVYFEMNVILFKNYKASTEEMKTKYKNEVNFFSFFSRD